jgi:prephenate dehydrogenase
MTEQKTIGIVGLGLMGASLALALRGFCGATLIGADTDELVCRRAVANGVVHHASMDVGGVIAQSDLLLFCVYAHHIPPILRLHAHKIRPDCLVSDICGVKTRLYAQIEPLIPACADYVGLHPMAGKERDGFENADGKLFHNCGCIITPLQRSKQSGIAAMKALASYIGATRVSVAAPEEHDKIIAYTSDLMHISAAALCMHPHIDMTPAFTAGAFRDCTRVADINAGAWTELLIDNRQNTLRSLTQYIGDLQAMRDALESRDVKRVYAMLQQAGDCKREMQYK